MKKADRLRSYVNRLVNEEFYEEDQGCWRFRSGGSCAVCTDSAIKIARHFRGKVLGYECATNPGAAIDKQVCGGHDFAIIDNRFVVDYWAFRVIGFITDPVLDLAKYLDAVEVARLYGDPSAWEEVVFE
jgi:hypothetical protein